MKIVESGTAIEFECGYCGEICYESDNLERDENDHDGCAIESDVIACDRCGEDNKVIRYI